EVAVWVGTIDDLWRFGKPTGTGGPWHQTEVTANTPSDPYLMNGFDKRSLTLSHTTDEPVNIRTELDIEGTGNWQPYQTLEVPAGESIEHEFPAALHAYWLRLVADKDCTATGQLVYQ